jgi:RNA polymerase sigma factor (sigma-70 family)
VGRKQHPSSSDFTNFCSKYMSVVTTRLKKIGVRTADVNDIAQKVFLRVHRHFDRVPAEGVEAWLFKICEQEAASHYRPLRERRERPEADTDFPMDEEFDQYERLELAQLMERAMKEMDPTLADILVRHVVDEQTLEDIAEELGISRNTAQSRLADAKRALQRKMVQLLRPIIPPNRRRLLLLPFGLDAIFRLDKPLSPEFLEETRREVWGRLARELGYPEELPPAPARAQRPPSDPPPNEPAIEREPAPPSSRRLREAVQPLLERILKDPLFWAVPCILGGYLLHPSSQKPLSSLQFPPVVVPIVLEVAQGTGPDVPATSTTASPAAPTATVARGPRVEVDLERQALVEAREGLRARRFTEVLAAMQEHARKYPKSPYATAREGYIIQALMGLGRVEEAQQRAAALRVEQPGDEIVNANHELVEGASQPAHSSNPR